MIECQEIKERLKNHRKLEEVIRQTFYSSPIEGAALNLAAALERYVLGLPLISVDQELRIFLSTLTTDERASWWREQNAKAQK
jgi:hypothetical protein